ncbi:MAG: pentapeptide repeat-containing protein [Rhodobacter sp.]|nr:pentapeptide repeat-containing protein [Rhodobacter sp.]
MPRRPKRTAAALADPTFDDRLFAAAKGLAARRQVTRSVTGAYGVQAVLTDWRDDVVARAAAIDQLEALVDERPDAAPRVAGLLSGYLREVSVEHGEEDGLWDDYLRLLALDGDGNDAADDALARFGLQREEVNVLSLQERAYGVQTMRWDLELAAQVLARLKRRNGVEVAAIGYPLKGAVLQGAKLTDACFGLAMLHGARLEGAILLRTDLQHANLREARLVGARLGQARLERAELHGAWLQGATLEGARMERAILVEARMAQSVLIEAQLQGAYLVRAEMPRAYLGQAALEGADLSDARLEGADLSEVKCDAGTIVEGAELRFAGVRSSDLSQVALSQDQLDAMFGDGSVALPAGLDRPAHWPDEDLGDAFHRHWQEWQVERDYRAPAKGE